MDKQTYEPPVEKRSFDSSRRFTNEEVWYMRCQVRSGVTMAALARHHQVSRPCIASAVQGTGTYEEV